MPELRDLSAQAFERARLASPPSDNGLFGLLDLIGRPGQAVRAGVVEAGRDVSNRGPAGLTDLLKAPTNPLGYLQQHPEVFEALGQGLSGQRQTDPTELPGMSNLPDDSMFQAGPVNITPRTIAAFAAGTIWSPELFEIMIAATPWVVALVVISIWPATLFSGVGPRNCSGLEFCSSFSASSAP